jgi:hypothetical protein
MTTLKNYQSVVRALDHASRLTPSEDSNKTQPFNGAPKMAMAMSAPKNDSVSGLLDELNAAAIGPAEEVKKGFAPMPRNVGILPPYNEAAALQNYDHLVEMSSLSALYTAIYTKNARTQRGHPEPYNITVAAEASQAIADMADAAYQVMTAPLAGFYTITSATQHTFSESMTKTEIHLEFLSELFKGFSLTKPALLQLDGILTQFIASLKTITVETQSSNSTVDHTLRINQVLRINISGDDDNPIWVFQPRTRIVYLKVEASSYKWATNKASHESSRFNMRYVVVDGDLNVNKYLASKIALNEIFRNLTGMNLKEYGQKINPPPIKSES